jgi:hypothetical protein
VVAGMRIPYAVEVDAQQRLPVQYPNGWIDARAS